MYKYLSADLALLSIRQNFLKFSVPQEFNDPYDIFVAIKRYGQEDFSRLYNTSAKLSRLRKNLVTIGVLATEAEFDERIKNPSFQFTILDSQKKFVQEWRDSIQDTISEHLAISCFSRSFDNILMWAHYAKNFGGVVLGFDYDGDDDIAQQLYEVKYRKSPVTVDVKYCYGGRSKSIIYRILTTKFIDWKYEQEVRMILPKKSLDQVISDGRVLWGLKGSNLHLKKIVIGQRFDHPDLNAEILKLKRNSDVELVAGMLKADEYRIVQRKLPNI